MKIILCISLLSGIVSLNAMNYKNNPYAPSLTNNAQSISITNPTPQNIGNAMAVQGLYNQHQTMQNTNSGIQNGIHNTQNALNNNK